MQCPFCRRDVAQLTIIFVPLQQVESITVNGKPSTRARRDIALSVCPECAERHRTKPIIGEPAHTND